MRTRRVKRSSGLRSVFTVGGGAWFGVGGQYLEYQEEAVEDEWVLEVIAYHEINKCVCTIGCL
jgi:hypothetical protein